MVELREVCIGESCHYYLFGSTKGKFFKKHIKYLGKKKPESFVLNKEKQKFIEQIKKSIDKPVEQTKNLIGLLQQIQEKEGYLSEDSIVKLCKELDVPAVELYGVATFYSQFKLKKAGKYKISLCRGTACHVKKSFELLKFLEEFLEIKVGETAKNGRFSLEAVNCIGACARAPAMMINGKVYGELNEAKIKQIISGLK
jgi:NADH:ubiquinone oxidoreductase subunit E